MTSPGQSNLVTATATPLRDTSWRALEGASIKALSLRFNVTPRALRFYEDQGLLASRRRGAMRVYDSHNVRRLAVIVALRRAGASLRDIQAFLALPPETFETGLLYRLQVLRRHRDSELNRLDEAIEALRHSGLDDLGFLDRLAGSLGAEGDGPRP